MNRILDCKAHPTELLVLAGGFGTRLRSAVSDVPKPLAPVVGHPFLYYLMDNWISQGITKFTFLLHHQADLIKAFLELEKNSGLFKKCQVRTLTEPQPLGTGGAIAYAVEYFRLNGSFLVTNADTWLGSSTEKLLDTSVPAMAVIQVVNTERYGSVSIDKGMAATFQEKQASFGPGWINAGLYHLDASYFHGWNEQPYSLERDLFPRLVDNNQLQAIPLKTDFIDIGVPEDYFRFCRWIQSGKEGPL